MSRLLATASGLPEISRRFFLSGAGKATLSASAVAMLAACETGAASHSGGDSMADAKADSDILNVALGLEHEAIAAYQLGAESGLLQKPVLQLAVQFQSHHKAHRDALIATVQKLGGTPAEASTLGEYAEGLGAGTLKSQADVLTLAARLEKGAANAYLGVIPSFADKDLAQISGRLAADETMHWTVLAQAIGEQLPANALSFGA
ncbi:MAG: ferritin-like domain-containing protein [Minwuia sp.]|uniref:ferritin-like domain-containing protein n=1 Tax=Minwuia sp. TaxID=2493630 RepID=UPI003A8684B2